MRKFKIIILALVILGALMIGIGFTFGLKGANLKEFFTDSYKYEKQETLVFKEDIHTIKIDTQTKSINLIGHDEDYVSVDYYLKEKETCTINNDEDSNILVINQKNNSLFTISFGFSPQKYDEIDIFVPFDQVLDVTLEADFSKINIENVLLNNLSININAGKIKIKNINESKNIKIKNDSGDISLTNLTTLALEIESDTSAITVKNVNANYIDVDIDTGNIQYINVYAAKSILLTDTGSITISGNYDDFSFNLKTDTGKITVDGIKKNKSCEIIKGENNIKASTNTGSIKLTTK